MSSIARRAALRLMAIVAALLPPRLAHWARAMARELDFIADDRTALRFALGCLRTAFTLALLDRLRASHAIGLRKASPQMWRYDAMNQLLGRPRLFGMLCAAGAVGLGFVYMSMAGAPSRYLLMNLAALVLGGTAWLVLGQGAGERLAKNGLAVFALSLPLLATAMFGLTADGAARWVSVGPLPVQISLVLLPLMIILYARRADAIGTAGMAVAAAALAMQPDRAMAGVLVAGLAAVVLAAPGRLPALALMFATGAFGVTLLIPDLAPASPFVDQILFTAFDVHMLAGIAVVAGCMILLAPALSATQGPPHHLPLLVAFGACWAAVVAAAALGNYPTPLVGYSGSAVLGYLLSISLLPDKLVDSVEAGAAQPSRQVPPQDQTTEFIGVTGPDRQALV